MNQKEKLLRIGDLVVALRKITEVEEGYEDHLLAQPGDIGQVVWLGDMNWPTIQFESGVTDCVPDLEVVRWSDHDTTVSRRVARG